MSSDSKSTHLAELTYGNHYQQYELSRDRFLEMARQSAPECPLSDNDLDDLRDSIEMHVGLAVGRFKWSAYKSSREAIINRLYGFERALTEVAEVLSSLGGKRTKLDLDVLSLMSLLRPAVAADDSTTFRQDASACRKAVKVVLKDIRNAKAAMTGLNGAGKPPQLWYEPIVESVLIIATKLNVPLTTQGDRSDNQHETAFTRLARDFEQLLPKGMRSPSLAACAKRIERSKAWAPYRVRLKASKKKRNEPRSLADLPPANWTVLS